MNRMTTPQFIVYTTSAFNCPYCLRTKSAFEEHAYTYEERDITDSLIKTELLQKRPSVRTIPQVFLAADDTYIGGYDDLMAMIASGELSLLLAMNAEVDEQSKPKCDQCINYVGKCPYCGSPRPDIKALAQSVSEASNHKGEPNI